MLTSILMAFSLYSRIPVPQAEWNEKSMRYCICFLPLVGAAIGAAQYALFFFLQKYSFSAIFCGAALAALPLLISGGIHMDGFLDVCDAIHSYGSRQKRLEILEDPHVGAFAVLGGLLYLLMDFAVWAEAASAWTSAAARPASGIIAGSSIPQDAVSAGASLVPPRQILALCLTFVLSRSLSAFAALSFPKAKKDGMLRAETDPAARGSALAMAAVSLLAGLCMVVASPPQGLFAVLAALATLLYYRHMALKIFGGISGDLSGWFTQACELAMAGAFVILGGWR